MENRLRGQEMSGTSSVTKQSKYCIQPGYLSLKTKIRIFESNVKSVLLCGCETWKSTAEIKRSMQAFINRCLRKILRLRWPEIITNEELWERTGQKPLDKEEKMALDWPHTPQIRNN
jgi:hypothetical protein